MKKFEKDFNLESREMKPTEILKYVEQLGRGLEQSAIHAQAMIEEAQERNILIDLSNNEALKKFEPTKEYEIMLINLRDELESVLSTIFTQGVKMTKEDLDTRLKKMGKLK